MVSPSQPKDITPETLPSPDAVPSFRRLAQNACVAVSPVVALCLLGGKLWLAFSVIAGLVLSLAVCGMLLLFVGLGMSHMISGRQDHSAAPDRGAQNIQFMLVLFAKFLALAGVGYAVMTLHSISLPLILIGFVIAQAAVVMTAIRHWTPRNAQNSRIKH